MQHNWDEKKQEPPLTIPWVKGCVKDLTGLNLYAGISSSIPKDKLEEMPLSNGSGLKQHNAREYWTIAQLLDVWEGTFIAHRHCVRNQQHPLQSTLKT